MEFIGENILSIDQFERADIDRILDVARLMELLLKDKKLQEFLRVQYLGICFLSRALGTRISLVVLLIYLAVR